jgi:protein CWC15
MTTAHRPTWNSVKGGSEQGGNILVQPSRQYSAKDMPAHLKLKTRHEGQGNIDE